MGTKELPVNTWENKVTYLFEKVFLWTQRKKSVYTFMWAFADGSRTKHEFCGKR